MYTHIRGTTFQFVGQFQNNGVVQDLTGWTVQAAVSDPTGTEQYGTLTVTVLDPVNGIIMLTFPSTASWPVGKARMDMLATLEDQTFGSEPSWFRIGQNPIV